MLLNEDDLYDEIRRLSEENEDLEARLKAQITWNKVTECENERLLNLLSAYDKQCQEVKRLKEIINKLTGG